MCHADRRYTADNYTKSDMQTFTFQCKQVDNIYLKSVEQVQDCYNYNVYQNSELVFSVYSASELTLFILPDTVIKVKRERGFLKKQHHKMYDNETNELVGTFEFPDWQWANKTTCFITYSDNSVYSFEESNKHRRLFNPKTWNKCVFGMHNYNGGTVTYSGSQMNGTIEVLNLTNLLVLASGLFIIDEKFRVSRESSG